MSSDDRAAETAAPPPETPDPDAQSEAADAIPAKRGWSKTRIAVVLVLGIFVLDVLALVLVPPYPKEHPAEPVQGISDLILANLELPAPEVVLPAGHQSPPGIVFFDVSITNTIVTTWLVIAVVLIIALHRPADDALAARRVPELLRVGL